MSPNDDRLSNRARLGLRLARTNIAGKNYHAASVTLQTFADEGVAQAESMLGLLYARGKGVERDFQKSQALFKSAAAKGDPDGLYYMGYSYLEGSGVEADPVTALAYYIQAAARGHEQAAVERDKGYAALDDTERVRADGRSRDLGLPMPAGWLHDSESGVAFWSPSWYRNGTYKVKVNARSVEGYAHGAGKVGLTASLPGTATARAVMLPAVLGAVLIALAPPASSAGSYAERYAEILARHTYEVSATAGVEVDYRALLREPAASQWREILAGLGSAPPPA